ncbi:MAG: T9SS type A sorting domain-containing protein, partial [Ignavibacteriaceae bacterium]
GTSWTEAATTGLEMGSIDWQRVSTDSIDIWSVGYTSSGGYHSVVYKKRIGFEVIPVELASFTANVQNGNVILNWQSSSEMNNRGFEIQRSVREVPSRDIGGQGSDVMEWKKIGFVEGYGTTTDPKQYTYTDKDITSGKYHYRLKQTDFNGSFKYSGEVEVEINPPNQFILIQNYPNPFNPTTTINYQLAQTGFVTLKIYDILGKEVSTLVNEQKNQGRYSVSFDASKLAGGVYIYQLRVNNYVSSKKMLLLK